MPKFIKNKLKSENRLVEIGSNGYGVFSDFESENNSLNESRKIADYRKMLSDGTVEALFNILTMPILASQYSIAAKDKSDEAEKQAEFVRNNLFSQNYEGGMEIPFSLFLDQAMMALVDGFQVWEKVYRLNKDGLYEIKKLALRDSRSVELIIDKKDGFQGVKQTQEDGTEIEIPAYKTLLFTHGKRYDSIYGRSIFTALWKNYDKKQKLEYLDNIALQNDAIKPKVLRRIESAPLQDGEGVFAKAMKALGRLGKLNSVVSIPSGYELDVLESNGRDPHQSIERQNSEMARVFLANFMLLGSQGSSSNGSFALSETQSKMFRLGIESIMKQLASHINQYLIADLIDINFMKPLYPVFKFENVDESITNGVFNAFMTLIQKDKVSDSMAEEIEDTTATRLGLDADKIRKRREELQNHHVIDGLDESKLYRTHKLSENDKNSPLNALNEKWQELEQRFLDQIRPVYEAEADRIANEVVDINSPSGVNKVSFPKEYKKILRTTFRQAFQIGKITASNENNIAAQKNSNDLSGVANEYIDWVINKQQDDLTNYIKKYVIKNNVVLSDSEEDKLSMLKKLLIGWFAEKIIQTSSYLVAQAVNSGRNSVWNDGDLIEFSAILDNHTSPGCNELDGKVMKWREWKKYPEYHPPRHFNCRSTFVKIANKTIGENEEIDHEKIHEIDEIASQTKDSLNIPKGVTKKDAVNSLKLKRNDPNYLTPAEESFVKRWGEKLGIERIPNTRDGTPKNDFIVDGKEIELKSIHLNKLGSMTVPNIIFKATDKGKRNVYIDIVGDLDIDDVADRVKKHISIKRNNDLIDEITVFKGKKQIKIK